MVDSGGGDRASLVARWGRHSGLGIDQTSAPQPSLVPEVSHGGSRTSPRNGIREWKRVGQGPEKLGDATFIGGERGSWAPTAEKAEGGFHGRQPGIAAITCCYDGIDEGNGKIDAGEGCGPRSGPGRRADGGGEGRQTGGRAASSGDRGRAEVGEGPASGVRLAVGGERPGRWARVAGRQGAGCGQLGRGAAAAAQVPGRKGGGAWWAGTGEKGGGGPRERKGCWEFFFYSNIFKYFSNEILN